MTTPMEMQAVEIASPGGPEVLRAVRRPRPTPGAGEVLVRVAAAGVNRPDVLQRLGKYAPPPGASDLPGLEIAGHVVGDGAALRDGDAVCALLPGGGYAEYAVAAEPLCLPVPRGFSMEEAAALPETFFTVWHNVFERGRLQAGETLLVHGGTSGIGTTAILLARAFGARVLATAGTPEKCAACLRLGAERAIDYKREDFAAAVAETTGGRGADVVLDMVGGPYLERNLACLATEGRLVVIAVQGGFKAELNLVTVMQKRLTLTGSTLRPRSVAEKAAIASALRERVWPRLDRGEIRPVLDARFPLADAAGAHRLMESGGHVGKIVLTAPGAV